MSRGYKARPISEFPPARACRSYLRSCGGQRRGGDIHRHDARSRALSRERDGLRADAAAGFENAAAGRIPRVGVEQLGERPGLIAEAFSFARRIAVDVVRS